jgi:hypothetical protein
VTCLFASQNSTADGRPDARNKKAASRRLFEFIT